MQWRFRFTKAFLLFSGCQVPNSGGPVLAYRGKPFTVRMKCYSHRFVDVSLQGPFELCCAEVPNSDCLISSARGNRFPIRSDSQSHDRAFMSCKDFSLTNLRIA